jgi:protein-disulfide isomerase
MSKRRYQRDRSSPRMDLKRGLLLVALAVILIGGGWLLTNNLAQNPNIATDPYKNAQPGPEPAIGPATAPVTIVEYGDFNCPVCRQWHEDKILNEIVGTYGDKVRFVWRDFPIKSPQSPRLAEAAHCAQDQGRFWQYHDVLYANEGRSTDADLLAFATQVGLDMPPFQDCLNSGRHRAEVDANLTEARGLGFPGTPSFTVNGHKYNGATPFVAFKVIVDQLLRGQ